MEAKVQSKLEDVHDCHYCPFEKDENGVPTQPRSYLSTEPGNMRATSNKHHPLDKPFLDYINSNLWDTYPRLLIIHQSVR